MTKRQLNNYKELIELIPSIQEAVLIAIERDQNTHVYDTKRVRIKAGLYSEIFKLIQGKWTIEIYYCIMALKRCGFNELKKAIPDINSRTLTDRLRFLENRGVVKRRVLADSPIRVEYSLTNFGKEAITLLIPFLFYHILPPSLKKSLPKIKNIEESAFQTISQETESINK